MMLRMVGVGLLVCLTASAALAQRERPLRFPPEKFSPRPVQIMNEASARLSPAANPERWPIVQTPWVKFCGKDPNDPHGKIVCLTMKEIRLRSHTEPLLAGAALIESASEGKRILRVTLPADLQRSAPVRLRVDDHVASSGNPGPCRPAGCMWDFPADAAFIAILKSGDSLHVEGTAASGELASYDLPLGGFAHVIDGAAVSPAMINERRRWEERSRDPSLQPR